MEGRKKKLWKVLGFLFVHFSFHHFLLLPVYNKFKVFFMNSRSLSVLAWMVKQIKAIQDFLFFFFLFYANMLELDDSIWSVKCCVSGLGRWLLRSWRVLRVKRVKARVRAVKILWNHNFPCNMVYDNRFFSSLPLCNVKRRGEERRRRSEGYKYTHSSENICWLWLDGWLASI